MNDRTGSGAGHLIILHPNDNIVVAARDLVAGTIIEISGEAIRLAHNIDLGHKLARVPMKAGDQVLRYGAPIGTMRAPVAPGDHVHGHNLDSNYIASTTRDVGEPKESDQ